MVIQARDSGTGLQQPARPPSPACHRILYTTFFESIAESGPFFGYYFFNALLATLQLLHVFWSYLVLRMICNFAIKGQVRAQLAHRRPSCSPSPARPEPHAPSLYAGKGHSQ